MYTTLDCGHIPAPHSEGSTGTAHMPDGREICWFCCDNELREQMKTCDHIDCYLASDYESLTTWSGGHLAIVESWHKALAGRYMHCYFTATDIHGNEWYGSSPGGGCFARLHKCKRSKK